MNFQNLIAKLVEFWTHHGCIAQQGHDVEVGAGTFNPATFLQSLGPEPFSTVYIEPSRRPQDARFGENPNRLHVFHQCQVLLKPSPKNIQELYLESLRYIGLDLSKHDVRFVHDDWESPTLGAWGLGWEVWLDGMEVTQFTYFQAVGLVPLDPISVELAYGLERLAMYIQGVDNIFDLQWNDEYTFRDLVHRHEIEWSHYNFEEASTDMWLRHFSDYEQEAKHLIERGYPLPAYDFVLKASHAFNILESRNAISVTERTGYISRVRNLCCLSAEAFVEMRKQLGHPRLKTKEPKPKEMPPQFDGKFDPEGLQDFLLEIGSEELPATFVPTAMQSIERLFKKLLKDYGLSFKDMKLFGTPRRLSIIISELQEGLPEKHLEKKGPPVHSAFDPNGNLSKSGQGFFKSLNIDPLHLDDIKNGQVSSVSIQEVKGVSYLFVNKVEPAISALQVLSETLPKLLSDIYFSKKMRWSDVKQTFARPIHWIVALLGNKLVPFEYAEVISSNYTFGHNQKGHQKLTISHPSEYETLLENNSVIVCPEKRKTSILNQIKELEEKYGAQVLEQSSVLKQVTFLTEDPKLVLGSFNQDFLSAPQEVIVSEMVEHQKYFPLAKDNKLMNEFVITTDNTPSELIVKGNEKVISARLYDGVFLYREDLKKPLENFLDDLKRMTFHAKLGSVYDKVKRLEKHTEVLLTIFPDLDSTLSLEAAKLAKADLATKLVGEFPELQGIIGGHYADHFGKDKKVCLAISEHYLPRFEADGCPETDYGKMISLADKLDNVIGYFLIGIRPTSSSDPYGIRRQVLAILKLLLEAKISIDLETLYEKIAKNFPDHSYGKEVSEDLLVYTKGRLKTLCEECGYKKDEIESIMKLRILNPYDHMLRLEAIRTFRGSEDFSQLFQVFKRAKGQIDGITKITFSKGLLKEPSEKALYDHIQSIELPLEKALGDKNYEMAIKLLSSFQDPLSTLYDEVKILADDVSIKDNRLALLQLVFESFNKLVDFGKLQQLD